MEIKNGLRRKNLLRANQGSIFLGGNFSSKIQMERTFAFTIFLFTCSKARMFCSLSWIVNWLDTKDLFSFKFRLVTRWSWTDCYVVYVYAFLVSKTLHAETCERDAHENTSLTTSITYFKKPDNIKREYLLQELLDLVN